MTDDGKSNFDRLWDKHHPVSAPRTPGSGSSTPPGAAPAYAKAALEGELDRINRAVENTRNDTLNKAAFNLAQLVAAGHLSYGETWDALADAALRTGLPPAEVRKTLTSAFGAGEKHPRDVPERDWEPIPEATDYEPGSEGSAEEPEQTTRERFPEVPWLDLWDQDDDEEWVLYPLLPARRLVALFSPPKIGKSLLMLEMAVAISRGEEVIGETPDQAHDVLYVDFENDPRGDVVTRLKAMGRKPEELDRLHYLSYPRLAYLDTATGAADLLEAVQEYGADVVVIDTISRIVAGEENDNDTWLAFYRHTGLALKQARVTCVRLDHTGKDQSKGMRGGSAKYGDVDAVWSLTKIAEDQLQVECTANRLPIKDKVLVLDRLTEPYLRHERKEGGWSGVASAQHLAAIDLMIEAGVTREDGWGSETKARLEDRGLYPSTTGGPRALGRRAYQDALKAWKAMPETYPVPIYSDAAAAVRTPWKDD